MSPTQLFRIAALSLSFSTVAAHGSDGVIEINQAAALAGGVTPGDTPGFPVTITSPGSYRLTSNLDSPIGTGAIQIAAINVTLDLAGFQVASTNACTGSPPTGCNVSFGVAGISSNQISVQVLRGVVIGMGGDCIGLLGASSRVEDVRALACGGSGVHAGPSGSVTRSFVGETLVTAFEWKVVAPRGTRRGRMVRSESFAIADLVGS